MTQPVQICITPHGANWYPAGRRDQGPRYILAAVADEETRIRADVLTVLERGDTLMQTRYLQQTLRHRWPNLTNGRLRGILRRMERDGLVYADQERWGRDGHRPGRITWSLIPRRDGPS
jgi:hypothetical protein